MYFNIIQYYLSGSKIRDFEKREFKGREDRQSTPSVPQFHFNFTYKQAPTPFSPGGRTYYDYVHFTLNEENILGIQHHYTDTRDHNDIVFVGETKRGIGITDNHLLRSFTQVFQNELGGRAAALLPSVTPINHIHITHLLESEGFTVLNPLHHQDQTLNRNIATLFETLKGRNVIDISPPST